VFPFEFEGKSRITIEAFNSSKSQTLTDVLTGSKRQSFAEQPLKRDQYVAALIRLG
jgi:hypothetical protein